MRFLVGIPHGYVSFYYEKRYKSEKIRNESMCDIQIVCEYENKKQGKCYDLPPPCNLV